MIIRPWLSQASQPFFMAVGFTRPHLPFSAPGKYGGLYDRERLPMPEYEYDPVGAPPYAVKRRGEIQQYTPVPEGDGVINDNLKRSLIRWKPAISPKNNPPNWNG